MSLFGIKEKIITVCPVFTTWTRKPKPRGIIIMEHYKIWQDIPHKYLDIILGNTPKEFSLPTEVIVSEAKIVTPMKGRYWSTDLYVDDEEINFGYITYHDLYEKYGKNFKGTSGYESVIIYELWSNDGEDGHVFFHHHGYVLGTMQEVSVFCDRKGYFCHISKNRYYP